MAVGGGSDEGSVGTFNVVVIHSKRNLRKLVGGLKNYLTRSSKLLCLFPVVFTWKMLSLTVVVLPCACFCLGFSSIVITDALLFDLLLSLDI